MPLMACHICQRFSQHIRCLHGAGPALIAFYACITFKTYQRNAGCQRRERRLLPYRLENARCVAGLGAVIAPLPDGFGYGPP